MDKRPAQLGPDGVARLPEIERKLNMLFLATFTTPAGAECLKHLRKITIEAVCGPDVPDATLRHLEGRRFLVGIIEQRIRAAHNQNRTPTNEPPQSPRSRVAARSAPASPARRPASE
jgi:hypothetical protein